jgi:RNA polymerase sigma-70 factor (sigma-E family)
MTVDEADFSAFVRARGTALLRFAVLLSGSASHGEDLFQTALERTYARTKAADIDNLEAYARRVMVHAARRQWTRRRARPEKLVAQAPEVAISGGQSDALARYALLAAMVALTRQQRAVIVLRYFADESDAEIARVLGCSVGTVRSHAARGLERLRSSSSAITGLEIARES